MVQNALIPCPEHSVPLVPAGQCGTSRAVWYEWNNGILSHIFDRAEECDTAQLHILPMEVMHVLNAGSMHLCIRLNSIF